MTIIEIVKAVPCPKHKTLIQFEFCFECPRNRYVEKDTINCHWMGEIYINGKKEEITGGIPLEESYDNLLSESVFEEEN